MISAAIWHWRHLNVMDFRMLGMRPSPLPPSLPCQVSFIIPTSLQRPTTRDRLAAAPAPSPGCYRVIMPDEQPEEPGTDIAEAIGVAITANASVKTWEESTLVGLPDGAILTLLHTIPVHDAEGEIVGAVKQPVAYYKLQAPTLLGVSRMFIRQTLLWAAQHADEETLAAGYEVLREYLTEAMEEYSSLQKQGLEQEVDDADESP